MKYRFSAALRILLPGLMLAAMVLGSAPGGRSFSPSILPSASAQVRQEELLNILLIGRDSRVPGESARSDSMILCSFDPQSKKLTMTSFLRDLYVTIPGYGKNRLNAAYAFGGSRLLKKTLERNFEVRVDGCVEVDFSCFPEIIDLLGGVSIELRDDEARCISRETGTHLDEGIQTLTGHQALAYSRIRKLDAEGDFGRTRRQRKVLIALLNGYRDAGLVKGLAIVRTLMPYVTTDMSRQTLLTHAKTMMPILSAMRLSSQTIPAPGTYVGRRMDGMDVLIVDMESAKKALADSIGCG